MSSVFIYYYFSLWRVTRMSVWQTCRKTREKKKEILNRVHCRYHLHGIYYILLHSINAYCWRLYKTIVSTLVLFHAFLQAGKIIILKSKILVLLAVLFYMIDFVRKFPTRVSVHCFTLYDWTLEDIFTGRKNVFAAEEKY